MNPEAPFDEDDPGPSSSTALEVGQILFMVIACVVGICIVFRLLSLTAGG